MSWNLIFTYVGIVFTALAVGITVAVVFADALTALGRYTEKWWKDEKGTTTIEYAIVLAVVVVTVAAVITPLCVSLCHGVTTQTQAIDADPAAPTRAHWR